MEIYLNFDNMRASLLLILVLIGYQLNGQYNEMIKVNVGISKDQFVIPNLMGSINDTSDTQFEFVSASPTLSYTHEVFLGDVLSFSGNLGGQYTNIWYDYQHLGATYLWLSFNPAVTIVNRPKFEYYVKLRAGVSFWFYEKSRLPDETRKLFPDTANMFTGVTLGGFNYFVNDKIGLNLELSVWSPEMATFGISYRYFRGELPEMQNGDI